MNLLFPTIKTEKPSHEIAITYTRVIGRLVAHKVLLFTLGLCALAVIIPFVTVAITPFVLIYVFPTLLLALGSVCSVVSKRFERLGALLCVIALENVLLAGASPLLLLPHPSDDLMLILYCFFLLCAFGVIVVLYRLRYKKFVDIMLSRAHNLRHPQKRPWAGFLGAVSIVIVVRLIVNTFATWMIGIAIVFMAIYYMSPLIAEQLVIVRQYSQMEPYLQEYAQEENEPEV